MPAILLGLVLLVAMAFGIAWFLRANPSTLARLLRPILVVLGVIGAGGLLIFGIRFVPSFLPELMGLAGVVIAALIARSARRRTSGGFSSPGTGAGQRTEVRTAFLQAWIDHATGTASSEMPALSTITSVKLVAAAIGAPIRIATSTAAEVSAQRRLLIFWKSSSRPIAFRLS